MIRDSLYFEYAGLKSIDFNIINVNMNTGMQEEPLTSSKTINKVKVRGRDKPFFQSIEKEVLKFSVSFAFEDTWDDEKIIEVTRWLTEQDYYQPLKFSSNIEKIYYALPIEDAVIIHNGLKQGYVNMTFECNSPYAYSPVFERVYNWHESDISYEKDRFNEGQLNNIILDNQGKLKIDERPKSWADFAPTTTWSDVMA